MKNTSLQNARKRVRNLFVLSSLFLLLFTSSFAQDTLYYQNFNREAGTIGCPAEIDFEPYIHFYENPNYYDNISCSDTALTVLREVSYADLFFSVSIESSKINFGDIIKFSFDITSLEENGAGISSAFDGYNYSVDGRGNFTYEFPEKYRDSIISYAQISDELEISLENSFSTLPNYFKMMFSMNGSFILDNFLITTDVITGISKIKNENSKILFYYTLEGRVVEEPEQGQFVIAMHENGERRKLIFNNK